MSKTWLVYRNDKWITTLHFNTEKTEQEARDHYTRTYKLNTEELVFMPL